MYKFEIPVTLSPIQDTFRIGDTITISSNFSDQVFDRVTCQRYPLIDFRFFPQMGITDLTDTSIMTQALKYFEVIVSKDFDFRRTMYSDGAITYIGEYNYFNNEYSLEYKIIPQKAGVYFMSHSSSILGLGDDQDFDGKCPDTGIDVYALLNEGDDNNIEFLKDSPDEQLNEWVFLDTDKRFYRVGAYAFYVVE